MDWLCWERALEVAPEVSEKALRSAEGKTAGQREYRIGAIGVRVDLHAMRAHGAFFATRRQRQSRQCWFVWMIPAVWPTECT